VFAPIRWRNTHISSFLTTGCVCRICLMSNPWDEYKITNYAKISRIMKSYVYIINGKLFQCVKKEGVSCSYNYVQLSKRPSVLFSVGKTVVCILKLSISIILFWKLKWIISLLNPERYLKRISNDRSQTQTGERIVRFTHLNIKSGPVNLRHRWYSLLLMNHIVDK
jgi:hypothetical protein